MATFVCRLATAAATALPTLMYACSDCACNLVNIMGLSGLFSCTTALKEDSMELQEKEEGRAVEICVPVLCDVLAK